MDIKLYAAQLEKLEAIKNPTLAQQEHIKALLTKPDKQSSEAAMDRVDELQRYHRKILAGEKLDDRALLDLPDTFAQGLRGGSAQAVTNTAALYAAEIYRNLPENQKKKFVENWVESRGETVQENLGKIQGWKAATKPEIVKEFVDDVDRRLKKEYGLEPPAPIKSTKPAPKDPSGTADPFASLDAPPRKSLDPFASLDIPSKQPAKQEEVAPPKPKPDIKLSESEAIAARTFQKSFTDGTTYGDFGQRIYNNAIKEGLSKDEAGGLAAWLSNGYRDMGRAQRGAKAGDNVAGGEDGVRGAIKNAENALQKLKPVTQSQLESRGQPVGELSRFIQVENPAEFIRSYGASIGKTIKQEGFFGTSTQSGDSPGMELYSSRANITYKITPNLRGDGQGRYVDHLKGWKKDQEGEILYPPGSSFKVTKIKNALSPAETSEWDSLEAAGGRMAALKAGMAVYTRYQALAKKANNYTVHLEEY
jgi:hypothetical protein